jgi:hypothetical protein
MSSTPRCRCFPGSLTLLLNTSAIPFPLCFVSLAFQHSPIVSHQGSNGPLKFSNTSLCTCHNLLTPEALHILTNTDASVLTSVGVKPLVDLNYCYRSCLLCQFSGAAYSLRPAQFSVYASPTLFTIRSFKINFGSAVGATLDTGGWLGLARQGLSPCKMHQD